MRSCKRLQTNDLLNENVYMHQCGKKILKNLFLVRFLGVTVDFIEHDIQNIFDHI